MDKLMNKPFTCVRAGHACVLALAATLSLPGLAGEPAPLGADELRGVPVVEVSTQLLALPGVQAHPARLAIGGATIDAVDLEALERERGRADTASTDTRLDGGVANNSAVNVSTGANTIDAGSFANMTGIPVVIQNSGANVLIQNATVINVQFQ